MAQVSQMPRLRPLRSRGLIYSAAVIRFNTEGLGERYHNDIFLHPQDFPVPASAYIAGAGPGLVEQMRLIPEGSYVVACNRAILLDYPFDLWLVYDPQAPFFDWFTHGLRRTNVPRAFGLALSRCDARYTFRHSPCLQPGRTLKEGALQGGATICGCALQMLFWWGATEIGLAGVPMRGPLHYDGTKASKNRGIWLNHATNFNRLANAINSRGCTTYSLGETALSVPVRTPAAAG